MVVTVGLTETAAGDVAVVGGRRPPFSDTLALLFDPRGQNFFPVWGRSVTNAPGGNVYDFLRVAPTADGGIVAAGRRQDRASGLSEIWIVRWSAAGERLWERIYSTSSYENEVAGIEPTSDGGLLVAGFVFGLPGWIWVLRTDADGLVPSSCGLRDRPATPFADASVDASRVRLDSTSTSIVPQTFNDATTVQPIDVGGTCAGPS